MPHDFKQLRLDRVSRRFAAPSGAITTAVDALSVTIPRGEFVALLGPSGCGKSTVLNCIAGLLPLSDGGIWLDDKRIDVLPPEKRGFGMVFQNYALFPHMTVRANVAFGLRMRGTPRPRAASPRRSRWCSSGATRTSCPASSRAASSSAWRSRARS